MTPMADSAVSPAATSLSWGGPGFAAYDGYLSAAPIPGPSAEPAASPAASTAEPPASPAGSGSAPASPAGSGGQDANLRQLRQQYETTKGQLDQYSKLGQFEQVQQAHQFQQRVNQEATTLAQQLGLPMDRVNIALREDPIETLQYLRAQAAQARPATADGKNLQDTIQRLVQEQTAPVNEFMNQQMAAAAAARVDGEFERLYNAEYKDYPPEFRELMFDATAELLKYDEAALDRIKQQGNVTDLAKYFDDAKGRILKAFNAWSQFQTRRAGGESRAPNAAPQDKKLTIDDIINDPSVLGPRYS